jgi:transcriptional regulator
MYIPKINLATDKPQIVQFMKQFSFATIITANNNLPIATHLPFLVTNIDEKIVLTSHFAKVNDHWKAIENSQILVIFCEPHAYISPKNYEKEQNVPTWNYVSVHAYGSGKIFIDQEKTFEILESTIKNYEPAYKNQWDKLPIDYKINMAKGIVAFEIEVTDLQAKEKLSQNRSEIEKHNIIASLSKSSDSNEKLIAEYMQVNIKKT